MKDRREYWRAYYQANREKKLAAAKRYYVENRDAINAFQRQKDRAMRTCAG